MSETTVRRMAATDFQTLHAQSDPDPVIELYRRLQMWASAPNVDGGALTPSAAIVPDETIAAVLAEISKLKSQLEEARRGLKVALHALKNVDGPFIVHDGEHGIFLAKEHDCTCWDAEQTVQALLNGCEEQAKENADV